MRRILIGLVLIGSLGNPITRAADGTGEAVGALEGWLKTPRDKRGGLGAFAGVALSKADAEKAKALLWEDRTNWLRETRKAELVAKVIELDGKKMKFEMLSF